MNFDLRFPLGLMFAIFGLILIGVGIFSSPDIYHKSLDINVNLWWGLVLLIFGGVMLKLAMHKK